MTLSANNQSNKVILMILDGWGIGNKDNTDAIAHASTPFVNSLKKNYPNSQLLTHGKNVGLPDGQMGNSEVGHINIGAGRVVFQELMRINNSIEDESILTQPNFKKLITSSKNNTLHLMGLVSDGGVHSHIEHFKGILNLLHKSDITNVMIHAFTDGRDTDPKGGANYLADLQEVAENSNSEIVSVVGRYYAMDRDKRWERTKIAYDLLVHGKGTATTDILKTVNDSYENDITDEFIAPIVKVDHQGQMKGRIKDGDSVLFVNFRTDRPRQITTVLTQEAFEEFDIKPLALDFYTMTQYDSTYKGLNVIFEKENVQGPLGEYLSENGKTQIRIAETEKYPHVTFFFNGGREIEFEGERRIMVNSPKVATYDLKPEMSAYEVTDKILKEIKKGDTDFICLNFANADMVGHTGDFQAAIKAVETVDGCVKQLVEEGLENDYHFLITADHGNSDKMVNPDGSPNTAHTTNPVPLFYVSNNKESLNLQDGILADLAPTILSIMGLPIPDVMTGKVLLS